MLEYFFKFGSLAGLVSAAFLIFDRFIRSRPSISLHRTVAYDAPDVKVRVINNDDSDLVIYTITCSTDQWVLKADSSTLSTIKAAMGHKLVDHVIPPNGEYIFELMRVGEEAVGPACKRQVFTMVWDLTGRPCPWRRRTRLWTSDAAIQQLARSGPMEAAPRVRGV